jgi:hypothetical protein
MHNKKDTKKKVFHLLIILIISSFSAIYHSKLFSFSCSPVSISTLSSFTNSSKDLQALLAILAAFTVLINTSVTTIACYSVSITDLLQLKTLHV